MGVRLERKKKRNWLVSLVYRASRVFPMSNPRARLRLFLNLEWIFERLALEESFEVFDKRTHPIRASALEFLDRHLLRSDRVLDLGCKEGEMATLLASRCREVVGIDLDAEAISVARQRNRADNVTFAEGDGVAYFQANAGRFEVVVVSHLIEHLDDPRPLLASAARSCRSVYVEVPDFDRSFSNSYRFLLRSDLLYSDADHVWEFDRRELRVLVLSCGLRVRDEETSHGVIRLWCEGMSAAPGALAGPDHDPEGDRRPA